MTAEIPEPDLTEPDQLRALVSSIEAAATHELKFVRSLIVENILHSTGRGFGVGTPVYGILRSVMALVTAAADANSKGNA